MTTRNTPGPYPLRIEKPPEMAMSPVKIVIITNQGNHYASTYDPAAARLIKLSPALLEFVESIAAWECDCDSPGDAESGSLCEGCRARILIARSEGKVA